MLAIVEEHCRNGPRFGCAKEQIQVVTCRGRYSGMMSEGSEGIYRVRKSSSGAVDKKAPMMGVRDLFKYRSGVR